MEDKFLTTAEVAGRLRTTEATVRNLANTGKLTATKVGSQYRILASDVDAMLARGRAEARADIASLTTDSGNSRR